MMDRANGSGLFRVGFSTTPATLGSPDDPFHMDVLRGAEAECRCIRICNRHEGYRAALEDVGLAYQREELGASTVRRNEERASLESVPPIRVEIAAQLVERGSVHDLR